MNIKETKITDLVNITNFNIESYLSVFENKDGSNVLNLMKAVKIPQDINPVFYAVYTPTKNESFQTISYKHYGTIKLWWFVCATNYIFNSTEGAKEHIPLKIIKPEYVQTILNELANDK